MVNMLWYLPKLNIINPNIVLYRSKLFFIKVVKDLHKFLIHIESMVLCFTIIMSSTIITWGS